MSDFVFLFRSTPEENRAAMGTPQQAQRSMEAFMKWVSGLEAKGHLKDRGLPLEPTGKVVRGAKKLVTDGPYAEAKDIVLGFMIVRARDLAEATELSKSCPIVEGGAVVEIRPVLATA
ncbi:MAG TPA: YciI family protein [Gemmatimonadaceae bacterium]|nr:YciI family protein [Gemmatimonadaceae bacterium]